MNARALVLLFACAASAAAPAVAQLRSAPQLGAGPQFGGSRPAAPVARGPQPADFIVAVVNSEPITNNEVRARMARFEQQLAQQGSPVPPRAEFAAEVLERLITERAQLQLARETGVRVDEALVDQAEANIARQNRIEVPELRRRLAADGIALTTFREELRNQLVLSRLREREVEPRVRVSDLDAERFLREQQEGSANAPQDINLAHILVAVPENASDAQVGQLQARAQRVLERVRAGEDFAKLAQEFSDAPGAATSGGQVGLRPVDRLPPLFVEATQNLPVGGVSSLVRSGAGFHIVKVLERQRTGMPGLNVTQNRARHILLRPTPQQPEAAARAKLADFRRRIQAGQADFAQLARESSEDASARNGGDLGWANPGMFVPEFEETMNSLQPGQIAEPIVSRFGVHLIQLVERRQATLSAREQREVARSALREKKLDEAYQQWIQDVRGRAYVEYRERPQ
jgi:peptidyl-prolyl cis-trans isomerase SurA